MRGELDAKIENAPRSPGVYLMKDGEGAIRKVVDRRSYSAIGREQQRREDAKKALANGELGG